MLMSQNVNNDVSKDSPIDFITIILCFRECWKFAYEKNILGIN